MLVSTNISKNDHIENQRKDVGTVDLLTMSKEIALKFDVSIVLSWDT